MARYNFEGKDYDFPDDVTQEEALAFIDSQHPSPEATKTAQEAPQGATNPTPQPNLPDATQSDSGGFMNTLEGMGRIAAGTVRNVANFGVGVANNVLSAADWATGDDLINYRIPEAGYGEYDEAMKPKGAAEQIGAGIGSTAAIALLNPAGAVEAVSGVVGSLARNAAYSVPQAIAEHNQGDDALGMAGDVILGAGLGAGLEGVGKYAGKALYSVLPKSMQRQVAEVVRPEAVQSTLQGGDEAAQAAYRTATTNQAGESILNPSQVFNTDKGAGYIRAEQRDLANRGDLSQYAQNIAEQKTGEGLTRAVDEAAPTQSLQEAAQDITGNFKERSRALYNDSKAQAQGILDSRYVTDMHMTNTKQLAQSHLDADAAAGRVNLNAETRRTLNQIQKTKFDSIDTLDNWKRALNEKASKAYRAGDYTSYDALNSVKNNLRNEADATIHSIDPTAGSIYRDADSYFSNSIGDFGEGKKSILGKISSTDNPETAGNVLFTSKNAKYNTELAANALEDSLSNGTLDDAAAKALNFGSALGGETRQRAINAATTGENFSSTKFVNTLNRFDPQAEQASRLTALSGGIDDQAVNNALRDAVNTTRVKAEVGKGYTPIIADLSGRAVGGAIGHTVGGPVGAFAGQATGAKVADRLGGGLLDRLRGTHGKAQKYINYLSDPANAKKVAAVLEQEGGLDAPLNRITDAIDFFTRGTAPATLSVNDGDQRTSVSPSATTAIEPDPVQYAQVAKRPDSTPVKEAAIEEPSFNAKTTKLYQSLAHAETGGLKNRFIRTKAAESGVSTAYGPAQITVSLMQDYMKKHADQLDVKERDYANRFIEQGNIMKHAPANDPVFGYGGVGTLGGSADRKLYANVARKMLDQMIKENGGSLEKTMHRWRGNDKDHAYFEKVRTHFHSS